MDYSQKSLRVGISRNGLGVFSLRSFRAEDQIGPIEGAIVEDPQYESDYCMEIGADLALEPDAPFRYLNHSCHPNCALVELAVEFDDSKVGRPQLWLQVEADIALGDELTIDYAWPARTAIPCHCGSPDCRGWIVAANQLEQVVQDARR